MFNRFHQHVVAVPSYDTDVAVAIVNGDAPVLAERKELAELHAGSRQDISENRAARNQAEQRYTKRLT
jgi:hypothetical protein